MEPLSFDFAAAGRVAGVDEVGRGPLVGNVVAAAVILDPARPIAGLTDSKKLSEKKREALYDLIRERALAWAIASASPAEIDSLNILHASLLAMPAGGAAAQPRARLCADRRQPLSAAALSLRSGGQGGSAGRGDQRRVHPGQGIPGPGDAGAA